MAETDETKTQTERVVLLGTTLDDEGLKALLTEDQLKLVTESEEGHTLWIEVGSTTADTKKKAVTDVVGNIFGRYRAPSKRSWKGGVEKVQPSLPVADTKTFD